jgi:hypothetical protein
VAHAAAQGEPAARIEPVAELEAVAMPEQPGSAAAALAEGAATPVAELAVATTAQAQLVVAMPALAEPAVAMPEVRAPREGQVAASPVEAAVQLVLCKVRAVRRKEAQQVPHPPWPCCVRRNQGIPISKVERRVRTAGKSS